jgi:hypothetical protein
MYYEVWDFQSGNLLGTPDGEAEALLLVGELIESGCSANELGVGVGYGEDEPAPVERPPVLTGPALAARVRTVRAQQA